MATAQRKAGNSASSVRTAGKKKKNRSAASARRSSVSGEKTPVRSTRKRQGAPEQRRRAGSRRDTRMKKEIGFLVLLAFSVILFLSNFGLGGAVGRTFSSAFFGLFGTLEYIFPIILIAGTVWISLNRKSPHLKRKIGGAVGLYLFVCAFAQILTVGYQEKIKISDFYRDGAYDHTGGGLTGGLIVSGLGRAFGVIGCWIVILICLIIFAIVMTQKPLLGMLREKGGQAYQNVKTNVKTEKKAVRRESVPVRSAAPSSIVIHHSETEEEKPGTAPERKQGPQLFRLGDEEKKGVSPEAAQSIEAEQSKREKTPEAEVRISHDSAVPDLTDYAEDPDLTDFGDPKQRKMVEPSFDRASADLMSAARRAKAQIPGSAGEGRGRPASGQAGAGEDQSSRENRFSGAKKEAGGYRYPGVGLLHRGTRRTQGESRNVLQEKADTLQRLFDDFGVSVSVDRNPSCGPTVTRFEITPDPGVKVSRITNLQDDIKLKLAATDIRIEAPIPGKSTIGIEVPNETNTTVGFRELVETREFRESRSKLTFAVGRDIAGAPIIADIAKMPHLLIAGATGSGKSVCINTLIMSILYKAAPDEVRFIMIDPKMVELSVYNGIPHLYIPVVTDPKKATGALNWAVAEMADRYNKFAELGVKDLKSYNAAVAKMRAEGSQTAPQKMASIVIIVDELADLMMVAKHEVEDAIVRLSQLARAAGIHLVIATQRPSVNVITGLIKANMPSRIALAVTSGVDSRTIIDMYGAEKLLGKGDMLFYPQGAANPERVQGAFLSDEEILNVVNFITAQNAQKKDGYDREVEKKISDASVQEGQGAASGAERDIYFEDAGKLIIGKNKASIGMLQRAFKIGFNRAARIMDQLSEAGVVGPEEGTKPRTILMTKEAFEHYLEEM